MAGNREEEKVNFPFSFLVALSSYLSISFRGFCPSRRGRRDVCAGRDEKLRDLITRPVLFAKIIARVVSFSSTIIYLFFHPHCVLSNFATTNVRRSRYDTVGFYSRFRVRPNNETLDYVSRLEMIHRKKKRRAIHSLLAAFNAIPCTIYNLRSDVNHGVVLGRGMDSI